MRTLNHPLPAAAPLRLAVVGATVTGLVTAGAYASFGHEVVLLDSEDAFDALVSFGGRATLEAGLEGLLIDAHRAGRLSFERRPGAWLVDVDIVLLCLDEADVRADGRQVPLRKLLEGIAAALRGHTTVIVRGAWPAGTLAQTEAWLRPCLPPGATIGVAYNPPTWRAGEVCRDALRPERVVLVATAGFDAALFMTLYAPLDVPLIRTEPARADVDVLDFGHMQGRPIAVALAIADALIVRLGPLNRASIAIYCDSSTPFGAAHRLVELVEACGAHVTVQCRSGADHAELIVAANLVDAVVVVEFEAILNGVALNNASTEVRRASIYVPGPTSSDPSHASDMQLPLLATG